MSSSLKIIRNILTALAYLEKMNIVHRDVKPQNIVLRSKNVIDDIVQVDFGFAIKVEDVDSKNKEQAYCVGTPGYIAPEMIEYRDYDCRADVFSAGCTLYLMMHYSPPFHAKNKNEVVKLNRKCEADFDFNNKDGYDYNYSEEIIDLVSLQMAKNPENRPFASEVLKHPAFEVIGKVEALLQENSELKKEVERENNIVDSLSKDTSSVICSNREISVNEYCDINEIEKHNSNSPWKNRSLNVSLKNDSDFDLKQIEKTSLDNIPEQKNL